MKRLLPSIAGGIVMLMLFTSIAFANGNTPMHRVSSSEAHRLAQIKLYESPMHPDAANHAAAYSGICDYTNTARIYEGPPVNQCVGFFGYGYVAGRWSPIASVYAYGAPAWIRYYDYSVAEYCWIGTNNFVTGQNTSGTITQMDPGYTNGFVCQNPLPHG